MDKHIIRYAKYDDYLLDADNISKDSMVYVEDKNIIIIKKHEYQCIREVNFDDLDNLKDDNPLNAYKVAGLYFVTGEYASHNISYGLLIVYTDSMCHACHQILIGNDITLDGEIIGHTDVGVTILFRSFSYIHIEDSIGKWTKWSELNSVNISSAITKVDTINEDVSTIKTDVSNLKETKYPIIRTTDVLYESGNLYLNFNTNTLKDADILVARRSTTLTPTNNGFDIYFTHNFTKNMIDYLYDNNIAFKTIKFRIFTGSSKVLNAGFYAQNATSLLSFSKQNNEGYIATDSTNKIYYRTLNPASANKKAINGMFINGELNVYVKTTSTGYSTIELKLD